VWIQIPEGVIEDTLGGASMGPHPERCGYVCGEGDEKEEEDASMGPHPERCGYAGVVRLRRVR